MQQIKVLRYINVFFNKAINYRLAYITGEFTKRKIIYVTADNPIILKK